MVDNIIRLEVDVMSENRRFKPKKAAFKRLVVAFILIAVVAAGIYALVTKTDDQAKDNNIRVQNEEKEAKKEPKDEGEKDAKGTVTKETSNEETSSKDTTNQDETPVNMPTYNKDAIIANAKTQIYTVYTDLQQGSGFLINNKGDILTNAHVAKDAGFVVVKNELGQEFQGKVIGISDKTDVALIRVPDLEGKNPLVLDTATAKVGTKVVAIGSPKDQYGTTTEGVIQSIGAEFVDDYTYKNLYEITARLNKGSSGGPLINAETGNVIGINSIILEDHPEIGYAIPLASVMGLVNKWSAQDIKIDFNEDTEFDNNHADEAYFDENFLKESMESYYVLLIQSIKNGEHKYYDTFIGNRPAMKEADAMVSRYTKDKQFKSLDYNVTGVTINKDYATVTMNTVAKYVDPKAKKTHTITENVAYTIIINDIGEYEISSIIVNSSVDTGKQVEEKPVEKPTTPVEKPEVDEPETEEPPTTDGKDDTKTDTEKEDVPADTSSVDSTTEE